MSPEFKTGLLTGTLACLWAGLALGGGFPGDYSRLGIATGYGSVALFLFTLPPLLRRLRAAHDGHLPPTRGGLAGLQAALIAALMVGPFLVAYHQALNPLWLENALETHVARLRAQHIAETTIRQAIQAVRAAHTPAGILGRTFLTFSVAGTGIAVATTLWLRRRPLRPTAD